MSSWTTVHSARELRAVCEGAWRVVLEDGETFTDLDLLADWIRHRVRYPVRVHPIPGPDQQPEREWRVLAPGVRPAVADGRHVTQQLARDVCEHWNKTEPADAWIESRVVGPWQKWRPSDED